MVRTWSIGYDHGNSTTTTVVNMGNGQQKVLTFPSATASGNLKDLVRARKAQGNESITSNYQALKPKEYVLEYGETVTYVGDLAVLQGQDASTGRGDTHRYGAHRNLECLLVSVAQLIPDTEFELLVVTGLPYASYSESRKKEVRHILNGNHSFQVNGRERRASVKVGKILAEGGGASILRFLDAKDDRDQGLHGVIDIGGYSTELYVSRGIEAEVSLCEGRDVGVEKALDKFCKWFEDTYEYPLSAYNKQQMIQGYFTGMCPTLKNDGHVIPPRDLVANFEQALGRVEAEIVQFISEKWKRGQQGKIASDFDSVDVIGGGPYYFFPAIQKVIKSAQMPKSPETANARGYAWFAEDLLLARKATA